MTTQPDLTIDERTLERGGWLISRVDANYRLRTLEVTATWGDEREFRLNFKGFFLVSWQILDDEYDPEIELLDVIGFDMEEHKGRRSAVLNVGLFEIILTYDELTIEKAW